MMSQQESPPPEEPVANPPAGGDQAFASTNDDNGNELLQTEPWVVIVEAHGQIGVISRFTNEADAQTRAGAEDVRRPDFAVVSAVRENDPASGLVPRLAQVEAAEFGGPTEPQPRAQRTQAERTPAKASSDKK